MSTTRWLRQLCASWSRSVVNFFCLFVFFLLLISYRSSFQSIFFSSKNDSLLLEQLDAEWRALVKPFGSDLRPPETLTEWLHVREYVVAYLQGDPAALIASTRRRLAAGANLLHDLSLALSRDEVVQEITDVGLVNTPFFNVPFFTQNPSPLVRRFGTVKGYFLMSLPTMAVANIFCWALAFKSVMSGDKGDPLLSSEAWDRLGRASVARGRNKARVVRSAWCRLLCELFLVPFKTMTPVLLLLSITLPLAFVGLTAVVDLTKDEDVLLVRVLACVLYTLFFGILAASFGWVALLAVFDEGTYSPPTTTNIVPACGSWTGPSFAPHDAMSAPSRSLKLDYYNIDGVDQHRKVKLTKDNMFAIVGLVLPLLQVFGLAMGLMPKAPLVHPPNIFNGTLAAEPPSESGALGAVYESFKKWVATVLGAFTHCVFHPLRVPLCSPSSSSSPRPGVFMLNIDLGRLFYHMSFWIMVSIAVIFLVMNSGWLASMAINDSIFSKQVNDGLRAATGGEIPENFMHHYANVRSSSDDGTAENDSEDRSPRIFVDEVVAAVDEIVEVATEKRLKKEIEVTEEDNQVSDDDDEEEEFLEEEDESRRSPIPRDQWLSKSRKRLIQVARKAQRIAVYSEIRSRSWWRLSFTVISNALFLTITQHLVSALDCTYDGQPYRKKGAAQTHFAHPYLDSDPETMCWRGAHIAYAMVGFLGVMIFVPVCILGPSFAMTDSDGKFLIDALDFRWSGSSLILDKVGGVGLVFLRTLTGDRWNWVAALWLLFGYGTMFIHSMRWPGERICSIRFAVQSKRMLYGMTALAGAAVLVECVRPSVCAIRCLPPF